MITIFVVATSAVGSNHDYASLFKNVLYFRFQFNTLMQCPNVVIKLSISIGIYDVQPGMEVI